MNTAGLSDRHCLGSAPAACQTFVSSIIQDLRSASSSGSGKNGGEPLRLVAREQLATPKPAKRLLFEIHVGKGLPVGVLYHKAAIQFLD
jgi:hypothetical protein